MSGRYDRFPPRGGGPPRGRDRRDDRWNGPDPRDSYANSSQTFASSHRRQSPPGRASHGGSDGPPTRYHRTRSPPRANSNSNSNPFANRYDRHQSPPVSFARSYSDRDSLEDRRNGPPAGPHRLDPRAQQLDPRASRQSSPTASTAFEAKPEASAYADLDPPKAVPLPRPPSPPPVPLRDEFGRMRQPVPSNGERAPLPPPRSRSPSQSARDVQAPVPSLFSRLGSPPTPPRRQQHQQHDFYYNNRGDDSIAKRPRLDERIGRRQASRSPPSASPSPPPRGHPHRNERRPPSPVRFPPAKRDFSSERDVDRDLKRPRTSHREGTPPLPPRGRAVSRSPRSASSDSSVEPTRARLSRPPPPVWDPPKGPAADRYRREANTGHGHGRGQGRLAPQANANGPPPGPRVAAPALAGVPTGPRAMRDKLHIDPPKGPRAKVVVGGGVNIKPSAIPTGPRAAVKKFFPGEDDDDETVHAGPARTGMSAAEAAQVRIRESADAAAAAAEAALLASRDRSQRSGYDERESERGVREGWFDRRYEGRSRPRDEREEWEAEQRHRERERERGGREPSHRPSWGPNQREDRYSRRPTGWEKERTPPRPPPKAAVAPPPIEVSVDSAPAAESIAAPTEAVQPIEPAAAEAEADPARVLNSNGEIYERLIQVGEGTYGKVYKARSYATGALVALKRIRMEAEKDGFPVTAVREIKLLQSLRHPNVVELIEMLVSRGHVYMVLGYMDHDLTGVLHHPTINFSPAHLKSLMAQFLDGLGFIHRRGVLHRDLKGSNILIGSDGELKIADFGLARFYAKGRDRDYTNRVITQWYKPPELLFGSTVYGAEVDMWSAGCIFLELFSRRPIFQGQDEIHQLDVIFKITGTPSVQSWPGLRDLPWYELVKPKAALPSAIRHTFANQLTPAALDVAEALLSLNPAGRPSAEECLKMPYFTTEEPKAQKPDILADVKGEWHEYESKRARRNKQQ